MKTTLYSILLVLFSLSALAQYPEVQPKKGRQAYIDSIKKVKYSYIFPALGQKARSKGIDIPLPHGAMVNYIYTKQDLKLTDLAVAFTSNPDEVPDFISLDSIAKFDHITGEANVFNFRFDTYVFPFLNVYGLLGRINTTTEVSLAEPIEFTTKTSNPGDYYGFGMLLAGGFGGFWTTADFNFAWTDLSLLDKPVRTRIIGLRVGKVFPFQAHPQQNVSFWLTAQNQTIFNETKGEIALSDIGVTGAKIDEWQAQLDTWYTNLSPPLQQRWEDRYNEMKTSLANVKGNIETGTVKYQFNKSLLTPWHFSVGGQWQINPHWQIRGEAGGAHKKQQYMISLNYRFGIKGRNIMSGTKESQPE